MTTRDSASRGEAGALSALADRVEREPPSRELDAAIASATCIAGQEFTNSIDAAMTLIPPAFHLDLHDWTWAEEPCWAASLQTAQGEPCWIHAKAATPAAALVAASLIARAAMMEKADEA